MKSLPLKLAIGIVVLFGLVIAGMLVYPRVKLYYLKKTLHSAKTDDLKAARTKLIESGTEGEKIVERYYDRNNTGWGRPSGGIVARLVYNEEKLAPDGTVYADLEIMNITGRRIHVEKALAKYNEYIPEGFARGRGGFRHGPIRNYKEIAYFPGDIEPDSVYRIPRWAWIQRVPVNPRDKTKGEQLSIYLHYSNYSGRCDSPTLLDRSRLIMRVDIKTGYDSKGPKAMTPKIEIVIEPSLDTKGKKGK